MTHSNTTIHNIDQQNQTISNRSNLSDLTSPLNLYEPLNQAVLNGSRVYHLVGTFIGPDNALEKEFINYFLSNPSRLNSVDSNGNNALHIAIEKNDFSNVKKLIALGIDREYKNIQGLDPLSYADSKSFTEIGNFLRELQPDKAILTSLQNHNKPSTIASTNLNLSNALSSRSTRGEVSLSS